MDNFLKDNDDLRFYVEKAIDWNERMELVEVFKHEDSPKDGEEAKEFYRDVLNLVGEFSAQNIAPYAAELDETPLVLKDGEVYFPERFDTIFDQLGEMDIHGMCMPRELGGMNCPFLVYLMSAELMARADVSVMAHHGFHGGIAMALLMYSTSEGSTSFNRETGEITSTRFQHEIDQIIHHGSWGSMDITEANAGSDVGALLTRGEQDDDGNWFVTGQKIYVTSGHGRYHVVIARTEDPKEDSEGMDGLGNMSLFLVETWRENDSGEKERLAHIIRIEEKLGHHASATVAIEFDRTPAKLIGERGKGFQQMLLLMNNARIAVGFESLGICESAWRMAREYAAERSSMGKTIDQHELIADILDEMETDIVGIRALAMRAAISTETLNREQIRLQHLVDPESEEGQALEKKLTRLKRRMRRVTPLVKYLSSEKSVEIARRCIQVHGGCGYTRDYGAEKLLRDAMVLPIYEGTSQIQCLMATKDHLLNIVRNPTLFLRQLSDAWRRSWSATDPLERRVYGIRYKALSALKTLLTRLAKDKWKTARNNEDLELKEAFAQWDPKTDFAPALLHAERLTKILADAEVCNALWEQAQKWEERRPALERYLERAEPRCSDQLNRIQSTGERLLRELGAKGAA